MTQFHGATRALGLGLVALVAIALILFVWRSDAASPKAASAPESTSAPVEAAQALATPAGPSNEPVREAPKEATVAVEANTAATTRTVQGTLRFRNESANPVLASGNVVLRLGESGTSREVSAPHKAGAFSFPATEDETECSVVSITIGRFEARATTARHTISAAGTLGIEIEWSPGTLLHVVDAATGAELDDVTIVALSQSTSGAGVPAQRFPLASARDTPLLRGQRSPFPLPRAASVETCWARAPGFAWAMANFEGGEGERRIELQRESSLELRITWDASSNRSVLLKLQDQRSGAYLLRERLESHAPLVRFDALPPGTWAAQLVHSIQRSDVVLARTVLELRPGETTAWNVASLAEGLKSTGDIEVRLKAPAHEGSTPWAQLVGPLPLDPDAEPAAVGLGRNESMAEWTGTFRALAPGEYELRIAAWNVTRAVSVFESQVTPVQIELPTLALLVVSVVDMEGTPLEAARVMYKPADDDGPQHELASARRDAATGRWTALVQPGPLDVSASAPELGSASRRVIVGDKGAEVVLTLASSANLPLRLTVRSGSALFPVPIGDWPKVRIEAVNGPGALARFEFGGRAAAAALSGARATVTTPGRYRVTLPRGFADLTAERSFEVDVLDGSGAELELQLDG